MPAASTRSAASSSRTATPTSNAYRLRDRRRPLDADRAAAASARRRGGGGARRQDPPDRRRVRARRGARQRRLARGLRSHADRWARRKALPGARDHVGCVAHDGLIHVIGGRFNTFEYNTDLHHVYLPAQDTWERARRCRRARSGHGLVVYRGRFFAMGGEGGVIVRRPAAPGEGLRPDGELRSRDRQLAAPRADADAAACGRRHHHRRLGSTSPAAARSSAARCSRRCTRRSRWGRNG